MKVIVFGGSGFLGSHVADALDDAGHKVVIYDTKTSSYLRSSQKMIVGDIMDERKVEDAMKGCDIVYNFAGIADIEEASKRPLESIKVNILGNAIVLEAARKANIKRFIFASSLYVYSKAGSFYRSSKQACELLIENYNEVFGLPYTILRYGSLYGPRADERSFIYQVIKEALSKQKITRYGDGEELREYIHVVDAAEGSVDILSEDFVNEYVVLTGNQQMQVKDLLLIIREMLGDKIAIEFLPSLKESYHYERTPYSFAPRMGKRLVRKIYLDINEGILEMINGLYKKNNKFPVYDGVIVKSK